MSATVACVATARKRIEEARDIIQAAVLAEATASAMIMIDADEVGFDCDLTARQCSRVDKRIHAEAPSYTHLRTSPLNARPAAGQPHIETPCAQNGRQNPTRKGGAPWRAP